MCIYIYIYIYLTIYFHVHGYVLWKCFASGSSSGSQAICTVSYPSSILSRSLPAKLSPSSLHSFLSVQHAVSLSPGEALPKLFPQFPLRPACCLAPSQRNSPQAISTVSSPSSMLSRSLPAKLSASYFHVFMSVQHAVSLPPSEAFRKLFARFPLRPACCLAPSQQSFPQTICTVSSPSSMLSRSLPPKLSATICTVSCPSSMLSRSLPAKLSPTYLHNFLFVQHTVSLPLGEALPKLFPRFPIRPACCLAPSERSFPQAICTVSYPSSMLSRSLPAKLSASYFHVFMSVQHAVSLPPSEAFRKLFARFPLRPACCLAPSQRSFPQAICTVSSPSSMLSRSLPAKLSPSYLHRFLSVQHAVSLPPSEAFPKLFARFPLRPACCLAPSRRSSPQAISTVSSPSSMLSRSLPAKLSASYLHGFLSVQHAVSLPPSEAFRKLFARFPLCPACCLAPSQRSSPQAICTVSCPSSILSRSLPAKLSPSYLHGFLSVQHAVSLPPGEALPKLFPQFPLRPACCLAPSQRNSPQAISTVSSPSSMLSRSLPAKLSASYLHGFLSVQHAVSLPPSEALPKLFAQFPLRPACCLAPSRRSSPQALCTVSSPSSMLSRSLPAKLSPSSLHSFLSVQHAVSLSPGEALPKLFPQFPLRPACCLAPSQRNSPQAISTVSSSSSMLSRSLPAKLSASYFHVFMSVQHAVSLPPSEAFRKLFARFPLRPACCLAPSQQSFPQTICTVSSPSSMLSRSLPPKLSATICTVSCPSSMLSRSLPAKLSPTYLHNFLFVQHTVSLPLGEALPKLFPRFPIRPACCSLPPSEAFRKLFARFPIRPACCLAPSQRNSQQAISTVSCPSRMLSRSLPAKLSASYLHGFLSVQHAVSLPPSEAFRKLFARFPLRPACCLAPSQRSSPQAICTVSCPSSILSRSLPAKLSPSYLHGFLSVQHAVSLPPGEALPKLFPQFPLRPACCLAPSQRNSPQAICTVSSPSSMLSRSLPAKLSPSYLHGFLSVQHAVSLPPSEALPKLFAPFPVRPAYCLAPSQRSSPQAICTVSSPSSMLSRSLPAKLSPSYFHSFLSVQHAVSLPPSETLRKLFPQFPLRPACCLAPSQRNSPQAICTVSYPSSILSRSLPAKLSPSSLHSFLSVQHAVSLSPGEALPKLFPQFPLRPACCLAPSQRNSPQAISTVSSPSSMLSRSHPAKLSASYFHGFLSVQHAVSLPPSEAFRKLFARFPLRPACCLAPSQRSFPQTICTVSSPSSMLSRSLPAKLSPTYLHNFLFVQHTVSLPLGEALPKLFPRFPIRPACCLAPSERSFPQAICTVSYPSSMLSRSLPAKLSANYFHVFLSVPHAVSLPPSEALPKLFAPFPVRPAYCLAPSQRSSPQAICTVSSPSSMLSRSLPAKLSPSYFHSFLSVQHAVSLPPSETLRKLFPQFPLRPACCLAPSQRNSPQAICTVSYPSSILSRSLPAKLSPSSLHSFLSVQHAVSLSPGEALPKLFPQFPLRPACCLAPSQQNSPQAISTVSSPSSMLSRSLPVKLSASYFHGFLSVQHAVSLPPSEAFRKLFARFPFRPACCLAPSQRSFPQTICTVSSPSSMLSRSLPAKLSPTYLHNFLFVQHTVSLPLGEALPKLFPRFPIRPACCLAPSERSFPQAIRTVSYPSSMLSRSLPAKLSANYFHVFLSVPHAVSLPPSEAFRKLFARFPLRPACCLAPSQRSFPQAICTVSSPSSMLSRSLPAKLSPSYLHRFLSVQHTVSLPPSEAFPKLFARFPLRPACCLAPSRRSSPQAISTVSSPSSMLSRSLPAKLSASYLHGFLSVQHAVSLPPSEAFRKLFARFPLRPACCLAPSQRSSPQAICTVSCPSSILSRSLPAKLSPSYLHGFLSVQHAVSLPPGEALPKLFPRFPVRPACCLAPSQSCFPQAICTVSSPSSMLSRSLPAKLSPSYLHRFLSVQHAVSLPPSEAFPKLFARFPVRPAYCLASYLHGFLSV